MENNFDELKELFVAVATESLNKRALVEHSKHFAKKYKTFGTCECYKKSILDMFDKLERAYELVEDIEEHYLG